MQNLKKKLVCCFKDWNNFGETWPDHSKSPKLAISFAPVVQSISCLTYKSTEKLSFITLKGDAKFEKKKKDLWFGKWNKEYGKFSPEHLKFSKMGLWWDPLIQRRKSMSLKSTELFVMTMKNDAKFVFQNWPQEFDNFHPST